MRVLEREDFLDIICGSSFYGGGGGGSAIEGRALLDSLKQEEQKLEMYDMEEMEDDPAVVSTMVAVLGSPIATKGRLFELEAVNAVKGMAAEVKYQGKELKYIYSGEQGGGNTMLPLFAAIKLGMPLLNTDGNGRAVPELGTSLQPIYGVPTSPVVLASEKGDTIVGRTVDPLDSKSCETIARHMCQAYGMGIGFCSWVMDRKQHETATAVGQMTKTIAVGHILRTVPVEKALGELESYLGSKHFTVLARGTIKQIIMEITGGFDTGTIVIDTTAGAYRVLFQNENLVVYDPAEKAVATVPSIISILEENGEYMNPLSNSEIKEGMKITITRTLCDQRWYAADGRGYDCWKEVLASAGYCTVGSEIR